MSYLANSNVIINQILELYTGNVFVNSGGNVTITSSDGFQGTVAGFMSLDSSGTNIQRMPLASEGNSTNVGSQLYPRSSQGLGSASSSTHGYLAGGPYAGLQYVEKFSFNTYASTFVGWGVVQRSQTCGNSSDVSGYNQAGFNGPRANNIEKYPFAVDTNSSDVGDLTVGRSISAQAGIPSPTHAYAGPGYSPLGNSENVIDRYPFASDTNATDVGDSDEANIDRIGISSGPVGYGYLLGGRGTGSPFLAPTTISRFPFASTTTNSTPVGTMSSGKGQTGSFSSVTAGYVWGPNYNSTPSPLPQGILKFPFASDSSATGIGELATAGRGQGHND